MKEETVVAPEVEATPEVSYELVDLGDAIQKTQGSVQGNFFDGFGRWG